MVQYRELARGLGFVEGPVALQNGVVAVTSIDHRCVYGVRADCPAPERLAWTGGGPNGAVEGEGGELYIAQNGGRMPGLSVGSGSKPEVQLAQGSRVDGGVQVVDPTGEVRWLTHDPISPNDLCIGPQGDLFVTDPTRTDARGRKARRDGRIWRCNPSTGESRLLVSVGWYPNGIGFGLEDDRLYVASTGEQRIVTFSVSEDGLSPPETYVQMSEGYPDGFAFDSDGNLFVCSISMDSRGGSVQVWNRNGELVEILRPGDDTHYTNIALLSGGQAVITSSKSGLVLAAGGLGVEPLPLHPFR